MRALVPAAKTLATGRAATSATQPRNSTDLSLHNRPNLSCRFLVLEPSFRDFEERWLPRAPITSSPSLHTRHHFSSLPRVAPASFPLHSSLLFTLPASPLSLTATPPPPTPARRTRLTVRDVHPERDGRLEGPAARHVTDGVATASEHQQRQVVLLHELHALPVT